MTSVTRYKLNYMTDTFGGQSGCPTSTWSDSNILYGVGIHAYGGCPNSSVRITSDVFNDLVNWGKS